MSKNNDVASFSVENAKIIFRNFRGEKGQYNRAGDKSFCLVISDPEMLDTLIAEGWNVKYCKPREEGEEHGDAYIPVKVKYDPIPPKIFLINGKGGKPTLLDEETVKSLDSADIENVDITVRPYCWEMNDGKSGVTAYVKVMYVTIVKDDFADKYNHYEEDEDAPWD